MPTPIAQLVFALLVTITTIILRMAIDLVLPGAGALSLLYPAVMIATLFGRWFCGFITMIMTTSYTIYFVLPPIGNFALENARDGPRLIVNVTVLIVTIILLEIFRSAIVRANAERDRQIAQGDLLLRELDHRVKNNFASVTSLLHLQRQRATSDIVRDELGTALSRVESIATVHRYLYRGGTADGAVDMGAFLGSLCNALASALMPSDRVALHCDADPVQIPRDRAIPIALIVNELVTNAGRHAFPDGRAGKVLVSFKSVGTGYVLVVEDNGCGLTAEPRAGGMGRRLIAAFVNDADGELKTESSAAGTRCTVMLR